MRKNYVDLDLPYGPRNMLIATAVTFLIPVIGAIWVNYYFCARDRDTRFQVGFWMLLSFLVHLLITFIIIGYKYDLFEYGLLPFYHVH